MHEKNIMYHKMLIIIKLRKNTEITLMKDLIYKVTPEVENSQKNLPTRNLSLQYRVENHILFFANIIF